MKRQGFQPLHPVDHVNIQSEVDIPCPAGSGQLGNGKFAGNFQHKFHWGRNGLDKTQCGSDIQCGTRTAPRGVEVHAAPSVRVHACDAVGCSPMGKVDRPLDPEVMGVPHRQFQPMFIGVGRQHSFADQRKSNGVRARTAKWVVDHVTALKQ